MKKSAGLFLVLFAVLSTTAFAAGPSRIAVAAEGRPPSSQVSGIAARCPYFLLFDEKGEFVEAVDNPHKDAPGGAGSQAVEFLAGKRVGVVIAGAFGPKMIGAMQAKGMSHLEFKGNAADAAKKALRR
ncbi:MAG TPA: NifB/NifX family molybdenum-iron cluster-binding protein [Geobacteraceae bacterium]|nr:NifB/NifX family molybdenum-iron cluster-binding protein [Geobacteraceae bacterium]